MNVPPWSSAPIIEKLMTLYQAQDFLEMVKTAEGFVADKSLTGLQKFRAIQTIIIRHPDHYAAMPMIDLVRPEMEHEMEMCRSFLAVYEEKHLGCSTFTQTLSPAERQMVAEARNFFAAHPLADEQNVAKTLLIGAPNTNEAGEMLMEAVSSKSAFSVLRMGDGEGRFSASLSDMPVISAKTEDIAKSIWFWNSRWPESAFWDEMRSAYREATIAGISPSYRIDLEYRQSVLGYVGVVNGNRLLLSGKKARPDSVFALGWFMHQLGDSFFRQLLPESAITHFIGPHSAIGEILSGLGARRVQTHVVPSDNIVPNSVHRPHYPDVFEEIKEDIKKDAEGLWLVSAGAYGKIYCNEVRKAGGVALDIGSMSDKWMKLKTR